MYNYGLLIARIGLSFVLFWFGWQQIVNTASWVGYIPDWATQLTSLSPNILVLLNGGTEIVFGALLLLGVYTRVVSALMGLHLALIAFSLGLGPTGVRDWGLAAALIALSFTGAGSISVDKKFK